MPFALIYGRWLLSLIALLVAGHPAFAQRNLTVAAPEPSEQRVALVIGNGAYKESPLKNPVNDAVDMAATLREFGFAVTLRSNASQRQMKQALREFGQALKKGGVGLFYFAGHGIQYRGRNFLVPVGSAIDSEAELEDESVDANLVLSYMEEAQNRVNIVILDACRNNPFARSFRSASRGLAQMEAARGSFVAFSTAPGSVASDGEGRNGVYTRQLLASLKQADSDIDKVFRRVTAEVSRSTGGKQVPWVSTSLTGDFYFRPVAQVAALAPPVAAAPPTLRTELVSPWLVTVQGEARVSILKILGLGEKKEGTFLLDATYGWIDGKQRHVRAEITQSGTERRLRITTPPGSVIVATLSADGSFTGTFTPKSGTTKVVRLEKFSGQDMQIKIKTALAAREARGRPEKLDRETSGRTTPQ